MMHLLVDLFLAPIEVNKDGIFDFTVSSATQEYFTAFGEETKRNRTGIKGYNELSETMKAPGVMRTIVDILKSMLPPQAIVIEIGGGSAGQKRSGQGFLAFKNYYPLDISYSHIRNYTTTYNRLGIVSNAETLPFKDSSVDCIYTNAFLEHPIRPDKVVSEIARVLKPGGIIVHNDAWFCRWWQRYGIYGVKTKSEMSAKEKILNTVIGVLEQPLLRVPPILLRRLFRLTFINKGALAYKKLKPNYNLYIGCDEDAASRIDPVDAIRFYESRDFELITPLSFWQRLFYPNKYIALRKLR